MLKMIDGTKIVKNKHSSANYICECGKFIKLRCDRANIEIFYCKDCKRKMGGKAHYDNGIGVNMPEYSTWKGIRSRCYNPNAKYYKYYGGRGIKMSEEWEHNFEQFYKDMGPRPSKEHEVERINANGNYCVENCKWDIRKNTCLNKRTTIYVEYKGERKILMDLVKERNLNYDSIYYRLYRNNWSVEDALDKPIKYRPKELIITYQGRTQSLRKWSKELDIKFHTLYYRIITNKQSPEEAFNKI